MCLIVVVLEKMLKLGFTRLQFRTTTAETQAKYAKYWAPYRALSVQNASNDFCIKNNEN